MMTPSRGAYHLTRPLAIFSDVLGGAGRVAPEQPRAPTQYHLAGGSAAHD